MSLISFMTSIAHRFIRSIARLSLGLSKACCCEKLAWRHKQGKLCWSANTFGILFTGGILDRQYAPQAMYWVRSCRLFQIVARIRIWSWPYRQDKTANSTRSSFLFRHSKSISSPPKSSFALGFGMKHLPCHSIKESIGQKCLIAIASLHQVGISTGSFPHVKKWWIRWV